MRHRVAIRPHHLYTAVVAGALAAGCGRGPQSIAPAGLVPLPAETVTAWVRPLAAVLPMRYDLRWQLRNSKGAASGRAAVRITPPDSLRFDFRGAFGKSGAAMVVGDSGVWAEPEGDFRDILQSVPLFWAALGLPLQPRGSPVSGLERPGLRAWSYVVAQDTFNFVHIRGPEERLLGEMRRRGRTVGTAEARLAPGGGRATQARLDFPAVETRFSFTVDLVDSTATFGPETWRRP
jgi:hypothetical protein